MSVPQVDIEAMNVEERLSLIEQLWESLRNTPTEIRLAPEQETELARRLDELDRGEVTGQPWEELRDRLRNELR